MANEKIGEFEELVLLAVCNLRENAYGVTIQEMMQNHTRRSASIGAVYAALDRLERKKFVESWIGGATEARGGRRKRFFRVTQSGLRALAVSREVRERFYRGILDILPAGGAA